MNISLHDLLAALLRPATVATVQPNNPLLGAFVIVRTDRAGVHCGTLAAQDGQAVTLTGAHRIWRWRGANTLHELSLRGADREWTRISEPVPTVCLMDAIEILPCSAAARVNLEDSRWGT